MNSSSIHRVTVPLNEDTLERLSHLCLLLVAINEACKKRERIAYIPGKGAKDKTLTEFQKFLNKLAMICDTRKGDHGATVTALVCLSGIHGPEYIFTSNFRKEAELEETKSFLSDLLTLLGLIQTNFIRNRYRSRFYGKVSYSTIASWNFTWDLWLMHWKNALIARAIEDHLVSITKLTYDLVFIDSILLI